MIPDHVDRVLMTVGVAHLVIFVVCLVARGVKAAPITGAHPALKPMKFGLSIAVFLGTMALIVPALAIDSAARRGVAWALSSTMLVEMVLIVFQALRGTMSHFNVRGLLNAAVWRTMMVAIVVATLTMAGVALAATVRPLDGAAGVPVDPLLATAWRAGLWLFLLSAYSGFSMGGRMRHSVGGEDGGPGLPILNWSTRHGDLRVSHFVSMHAIQSLPLVAWVLGRLPLGVGARWTLLVAAIGAHGFIAVWTLLRAMAGVAWGARVR
jgi:hypothetical protein